MMWADAGVNLLDPRLSHEDVFLRAQDANVSCMLMISSTIDEVQQSLSFIEQHILTSANIRIQAEISPIQLACTAGVHPHYANETNSNTWSQLKSLLVDKHIMAIGECGLDFNRNFSSPKNQRYAFEQQLAIACEFNKGIYLHERDAFDEQFRMLEKYAVDLPFMVSHCFTGNAEQLKAYISLGCYIGITGWLCDEKRGADLRAAVKHLPLNRLLLETDSPYLFPKTLRPRRSVNEPCNVPYIGQALANILELDSELVQQYSFKNTQQLFFDKAKNDEKGDNAN